MKSLGTLEGEESDPEILRSRRSTLGSIGRTHRYTPRHVGARSRSHSSFPHLQDAPRADHRGDRPRADHRGDRPRAAGDAHRDGLCNRDGGARVCSGPAGVLRTRVRCRLCSRARRRTYPGDHRSPCGLDRNPTAHRRILARAVGVARSHSERSHGRDVRIRTSSCAVRVCAGGVPPYSAGSDRAIGGTDSSRLIARNRRGCRVCNGRFGVARLGQRRAAISSGLSRSGIHAIARQFLHRRDAQGRSTRAARLVDVDADLTRRAARTCAQAARGEVARSSSAAVCSRLVM